MDQDFYGRPVAGAPSAASTTAPTPVRPGTPNTDGGRNPFSDGVESQASNRPPLNPFASPAASRPASSFGSSSALGRFDERTQRYFHSRRVRKGEIEKPWVGKPHPKEKWVTILPILGIVIGLGISGFLVYDGITSVVQHNYCPRLDTDFSGGFDSDVWTREVEVGGFGNGEFEMTTDSDENVFVEDGRLVIRATLQDQKLIDQNTRIDLRKNGGDSDDRSRYGTCTGQTFASCVASTNTTSGNSSIVPPVLSGRINTRNAPDGLGRLKYGRVEVTAKMPEGKWLWPAIWLMPAEDKYGPWPRSGEIDIAESRGNKFPYSEGANNVVSSALHWGPDASLDGYWKTNNKRSALHTTYSAGFNTFGLEWSQKYLFTYVNSRLLQVMYVNFDTSLWDRGNFPEANSNGTRVQDPWSFTGRKNTPFDQEFYLILNVAVGGTNGWFPDNEDGKPWIGAHENAPKDFWKARDEWLPTWTSPQMEVKRVQIWQQCDGNEDL